MTDEEKQVYRKAFDLKAAERYPEAIAEFKRIMEDDKDKAFVCSLLIAMLYHYKLEEHQNALPFARQAVKLRPKSERASLCLLHTLFDLNLHREVEQEIRRYVAADGLIDAYNILFEENNVTVDDFK